MSDILASVSVVIPFYNSNDFLFDALDSVYEQVVRPIKIILVVDKGSAKPILREQDILKDLVVIYNDGPIGGAGVVRAIGYNYARGDYVAFLDADDRWLPEKISIQIPYMVTNNLAFCFGGYRNFDLSGSTSLITPRGPYTLPRFFGKGFTIGCLTVVVSKKAIPKVDPVFLKRRNDYLMWYRVIKHCQDAGLRWGGFNAVLGEHRLHAQSLTASKFKSAVYQFNFYRAAGQNLYKVFFFMLSYVANTSKNRLYGFIKRLS